MIFGKSFTVSRGALVSPLSCWQSPCDTALEVLFLNAPNAHGLGLQSENAANGTFLSQEGVKSTHQYLMNIDQLQCNFSAVVQCEDVHFCSHFWGVATLVSIQVQTKLFKQLLEHIHSGLSVFQWGPD